MLLAKWHLFIPLLFFIGFWALTILAMNLKEDSIINRRLRGRGSLTIGVSMIAWSLIMVGMVPKLIGY
jgi:hypothetical protein